MLFRSGAKMASSAARGTLSNPFVANSAGLSGKGSVARGFQESAANIGKLVGRGGLQSGSRLIGAVNAWGSLGMNTYRMAALNIGMGFTGKLLRTSGVLNALDNGSALGGLVNFVFGEMGMAKGANGEMVELGWGEIVTNAFSAESLTQSAMFGTIMYAFMPVVSGFANKISGGRLAQKAAAEYADDAAKNLRLDRKSVV